MIEIYTHGSCPSDPGPGGWAAIIATVDKGRAVAKGGVEETTNDRIELTAILEGLACTNPKSDIRLHSNSRYVKQIVTQERERDEENLALWKNIDRMLKRRQVEWVWAEGPDKHEEDDNAAEIATSMIPMKTGE